MPQIFKASDRRRASDALDLITKASIAINKHQPFYSNVFNSMTRVASDDIDTMGVRFKDGSPIFVYNRQWVIDNLGEQFARAAILHEIEHIVRLHPVRLAKYINGDTSAKYHKLWNYAIDMAVNGDLLTAGHRVDPMWVYPSCMGYSNGLTAEVYFKQLLQDSKGGSGGGGGLGGLDGANQFDSHDWTSVEISKDADGKTKIKSSKKPLTKADIDIINENIGNIIKDAISRAPGDVPAHLKKEIDAILEPPKIDWRVKLKSVVGKAETTRSKRSIMKRNKRYNYFGARGRKKQRKRAICVAVDVSGSVSNEVYVDFMKEVNGMVDDMTNVYIVQADHGIQNISKYEQHSKPEDLLVRHGYGGTSFVAPLKFSCGSVDEEDYVYPEVYEEAMRIIHAFGRFDIIIYLTDGYGDNPPKFPIKTVWVTTEAEPSLYGEIIKLEK